MEIEIPGGMIRADKYIMSGKHLYLCVVCR